jgi:hypothetical protein
MAFMVAQANVVLAGYARAESAMMLFSTTQKYDARKRAIAT